MSANIYLTSDFSVLSAAVLVLYDYLLTFPLEVRHMWNRKMSIMKILFILNRYFGPISLYGEVLVDLIQYKTNLGCSVFYYIQGITRILVIFVISSIFTLRTYAIYGSSRTVFFLLAIPALIASSSSIWEIATRAPVAFPLGPEFPKEFGPFLCNVFYSDAPSFFTANVVALAFGTTFNALVIILTVQRTGHLVLLSRKANISGSGSLSFILFRDGIVYYSALLVPAIVNVLVFVKTGGIDLVDFREALNLISNSIQVIMVNRLALNLCHTANAREDSEFRTRTGLEPPTFATGTILGSIGGPVRTLQDLDDVLCEDCETMDEDEVQRKRTSSSKILNVVIDVQGV